MNRWFASGIWVAAMIGAWFTFVPAVLSASSWVVTTLAGPLFLVGGAAWWNAGGPNPSWRQAEQPAEPAPASPRSRR